MCLDDLDCCDLLCGALCAVCCFQMCKSSSPPPQTVIVHHQQPIYQQPQGYQTGPYQPYVQQQAGYPPYQGQGMSYPQQPVQTFSQGVPITVQPVRSGFDGQPPTNPGYAPPPYQ